MEVLSISNTIIETCRILDILISFGNFADFCGSARVSEVDGWVTYA
jgi:hypothetical protein